MRHIYSLLLYISLPFLFLRLWWKDKKIPGYRLRWRERLGFIPYISAESLIWIHAVSLGEMIAAKPLIQALSTHYPHKTLVITTTTVTGSSLAKQYVGEKVHHYYLPYDLPSAIKRFLKRTSPEQVIIMETELWPNLLHYTAERNIPILLANARLSEISMRSYLRIVWLTQEMLRPIRCIAAQTQQDADRFIKLGAKSEQICIMGNIKFDVPLPADLVEKGRVLRQQYEKKKNGLMRPTVIAASTHPGEEEKILQAFHLLLASFPDMLLILVPRHTERCDEVMQLCEKKGFTVIRRTQNQICSLETKIFLGDTLGELFLYYAMSDIAFVGGSFVNIGGHNLLEPAALGLPIITGPFIFNFTEIFNLLHQAGAVLSVTDTEHLAKIWITLMQDSKRCEQMGQAGQKVVEENRGAVAKHIDYLNLSFRI